MVRELSVSRERIRQVEAKALRLLGEPERVRRLRSLTANNPYPVL